MLLTLNAQTLSLFRFNLEGTAKVPVRTDQGVESLPLWEHVDPFTQFASEMFRETPANMRAFPGIEGMILEDPDLPRRWCLTVADAERKKGPYEFSAALSRRLFFSQLPRGISPSVGLNWLGSSIQTKFSKRELDVHIELCGGGDSDLRLSQSTVIFREDPPVAINTYSLFLPTEYLQSHFEEKLAPTELALLLSALICHHTPGFSHEDFGFQFGDQDLFLLPIDSQGRFYLTAEQSVKREDKFSIVTDAEVPSDVDDEVLKWGKLDFDITISYQAGRFQIHQETHGWSQFAPSPIIAGLFRAAFETIHNRLRVGDLPHASPISYRP